MKTALILFAIAILSTSSGKKCYNSLEEYNLKGHVKSVVNKEYIVSAGKEYVRHNDIAWYDVAGNVVVDSSLSHDTIFLPVRHAYKYNESGRRTEQLQLVSPGEQPGWKTLFTYDKDGFLSETNRYHPNGGLMQRVIFRYDESGNNTEQYSYSSDGKPNGIEVRRYDENGNLVQSNDYSIDAQYGSKYAVQYSSKGNLLSTVEEHFGDSMQTTVRHCRKARYSGTSYDAKGNWIKTTRITDGGWYIDTAIVKRTITYY
ncbi:hypothetical protein CJD36_008935 [Flavipsychrobacter stenotrophus]|uniref:Uncharacterized protein n=1 Tax=Flavipsychrobacter stenotrophus TaxID=2077091 RepID=A0A2S7SYY7_9BACT|nr:hypothetical protein [Flavipsychrobacter stenotrophus]PQJ11908.1 hypothetical protein CJD36_008935 [Flavipsychrobacter stenotrophus]